MATKTYDVIVIGAGVVGAAAAYHLAQRGQRILALEQFELDHPMGSSYGESRIIRYAYKDSIYVDMAKEAFPMWRDLEQHSGKRLLTPSGGFDFGPADSPSLLATRDHLAAAGIAYEWLTATEAARRFPQFRLNQDMAAIYQPDAAILNASACVRTLAEMAQNYGAVLKTKCPVTKIEPLSDSVRVQTPKAGFSARRVVISAGAWAGKLLQALDLNLPLTPTRQEQMFFEPARRAMFLPGTFPVFIHHQDPWIYGLPDMGTGLKVAIHNLSHATDPDDTRHARDEASVATVREWVKRFLPWGDGPIRERRECLYTMTPDEHFIIDTHPAYPNVVIGSPCSGHGFKFGILTGRLLADLAQGRAPTQERFKVRRLLG
ncbi:N-methyl-L-tryptophan oxidase [Methylocaldum sp.]|uniref:N-methyl-L-tryptophan oxidase n=1 Tax=Methylocaldum sp. TaxID=1969727 RepID=UPI002D4A4EBC|nr:N-methyl-L-tryptophan oxidase [Methylocaldum sp.]HYE34126.1 N-methyl-L-tryptophan oxidase [Methylocaldum sp.]